MARIKVIFFRMMRAFIYNLNLFTHLFQISKDQIWLMLLIWDSEAILEVIYIYKVTQMKKKTFKFKSTQ